MSERLPGIRPRVSLWRRLDMLARRGFPATLSAILLLLAAAPLGVEGQAELQVAVAFGCVWFWTLFRPASMRPWAVFALGLLLDLLGFAPLGVGVLLLLAMHGFGFRWRRFLVRQGFLAVWLVFALLAAGAAACQWLLVSVLSLRVMPFAPVWFLTGLAIGLYPLLAMPLTVAHRTLADPDVA